MANILYFKIEDTFSKDEKFKFLNNEKNVYNVNFTELTPNKNHVWLTEGLENNFELLIPLDGKKKNGIYQTFSNGVKSNNDSFIFNSDRRKLEEIYLSMVENYQFHYHKFLSKGSPKNVENILEVNEKVLKWIRYTKKCLARGKQANLNLSNIRFSIYRPFYKLFYNSDRMFSEELYQFPKIFPTPESEKENKVICLSGVGSSKPFQTLIVNFIPCLDMLEKTQCFPFYTYSEDGTGRKENISDWALKEFQTNFKDESISKWDIFFYIYGVLHKPEYREKYAANLRRSLPRIPFYEDFWKYSNAGKKLAELHVNYEEQPEYPLTKIEAPGKMLDWKVDKMKYIKTDSDMLAIKYNDFLTIAGIPYEVKEYKLGNRSALDWLIDQYQIKTDKRSGITNDPNRSDEPDYIVKLIGIIVYVSLETVKVVKNF